MSPTEACRLAGLSLWHTSAFATEFCKMRSAPAKDRTMVLPSFTQGRRIGWGFALLCTLKVTTFSILKPGCPTSARCLHKHTSCHSFSLALCLSVSLSLSLSGSGVGHCLPVCCSQRESCSQFAHSLPRVVALPSGAAYSLRSSQPPNIGIMYLDTDFETSDCKWAQCWPGGSAPRRLGLPRRSLAGPGVPDPRFRFAVCCDVCF